jgi:hypothetical protein
MKKIIFSLVIIICLATVLSAQAQVNQAASSTVALPGSSKYFFKQVKNYLQSIFTFKPENKLALNLKFANEKLAETQALTKNQNSNPENNKLVTDHLQAYQNIMAKVQANLTKIEEKNKDALTNQVIKQQIEQQEILHTLNQQTELPLEQAKKLNETKDIETTNLLENLKNSPNQKEIITAVTSDNAIGLQIIDNVYQKVEKGNLKQLLFEKKSNLANTIITQNQANHFLSFASKQIEKNKVKAGAFLNTDVFDNFIIDGAAAGECFAEQAADNNYQWFMWSLLNNNEKKLNNDTYLDLASRIKTVQLPAFKECLVSKKYYPQITADLFLLKNKFAAMDTEVKSDNSSSGGSYFFALAKDFIKTYGKKAKLAISSGLISEEKIINAAEAGECVAEQAPKKTYRYYMEDLMNNYKNLSIDFYVTAAETITPFNMEKFKACLISGKYQAQIKSDYQKLLQ